MKSLPTVEIQNPEDPKGKLVINESDFDPKVHKLFDPLAAQSAKAQEVNAEAEKQAEEEAPEEKAPAKKAAAKSAKK